MNYYLYVILVEEEENISMELKVFENDKQAQEYVDMNFDYLENQNIFFEKIEKVDNFQVFVKYTGNLQ